MNDPPPCPRPPAVRAKRTRTPPRSPRVPITHLLSSPQHPHYTGLSVIPNRDHKSNRTKMSENRRLQHVTAKRTSAWSWRDVPRLGEHRKETQRRIDESPDDQAPVKESIELLTTCLWQKSTSITRSEVARVRPLPLLARIHADRIRGAPPSIGDCRRKDQTQVVGPGHTHKAAHRALRVSCSRIDEEARHLTSSSA